MRFPYMICPAQDLGVSAWSDIHCTPNPVFLWTHFEWPSFVQAAAQSVVSPQCLMPFDIIGGSLTISTCADWTKHSRYSLCSFPNPFLDHGCIRLACRTLWRLLCKWFQASFRYQGLWRQHSWTRRYDRSNGLPVCLPESLEILSIPR